MVAFRHGNEWHVRLLPESVPRDVISKFLHYTMDAIYCMEESGTSEFGDYYSLRPLVYGGQYWLDTVCRQEFDRYKDLKETEILSVIVIPWQENWSLFELVESLRRGDRIGYFEDLLGVLLPFTDESQLQSVSERLKANFDIDQVYCWQIERDFQNLHTLTSQVKELL